MTASYSLLRYACLFSLLLSAPAFSPSCNTHHHHRATTLRATTEEGVDQEPARNPDRPELPAVAGDYDWDAKYKDDPTWVPLSTPDLPGRKVLSDMEIAQQATALGALEDKWRQERLEQEYEDSAKTGFVPLAELLNGRTAMFFLVTGLLTEYWTGVSLPGQVEEMLRIGGFIGFD